LTTMHALLNVRRLSWLTIIRLCLLLLLKTLMSDKNSYRTFKLDGIKQVYFEKLIRFENNQHLFKCPFHLNRFI